MRGKGRLGILVSVILLSGILGVISFEDAEAKKPKEIVVVGSKVKDVVRNAKLTDCNINFLNDAGDSILSISEKDKGGKVKADVPDDAAVAEIQCNFKDGSVSELLLIELDDEDKKQKIRIQSGDDAGVDSFFDVFFDVELYSVDSFFDIFTELQNTAASVDSFFDVFFDVDVNGQRNIPDSFFDIFVDVDTGARPDSFFDIFVDLHETDEELESVLNQEIADRQASDQTIQTELVALDLRGQTCPQGEVMVGIDPIGDIICIPLANVLPAPDCSAQNDCSGNGMCVADNLCQCDTGFAGDDCSVPDDQCNAVNCDQCVAGEPNICQSCSSGFFMDSTGQCTLQDNDFDGFTSDVDCDDSNPNVHPGATEILGDSLDNDCDGVTDPVNLVGVWSLAPTLSVQCTADATNISPPLSVDGTISISELTVTQDASEMTFSTVFDFDFSLFPIPSQTVDFATEPLVPYPSFSVSGVPVSLSGTFTGPTTFDGVASVSPYTDNLSAGGFDIELSCDAINSQAFTATK